MTAFFTSFLLIAVAEMADKTQILTLSLACRYRARDVALGVGAAIALLNGLAVGVGALAGRLIPMTAVRVMAGALFIFFALWMLNSLRHKTPDDECEANAVRARFAPLAVGAAFFVAELGDKTQLAALSLAARFDSYVLVWAGATLGMAVANLAALLVGRWLGKRLPERWVSVASALLFLGFGVWTVIEALATTGH